MFNEANKSLRLREETVVLIKLSKASIKAQHSAELRLNTGDSTSTGGSAATAMIGVNRGWTGLSNFKFEKERLGHWLVSGVGSGDSKMVQGTAGGSLNC